MGLEFLKKESIFAEIREVIEEKEPVKIECPISLNTYTVKEIRPIELNKLKKSFSSFSKLNRSLLDLVISKLDAEPERVLNDNSYLDYQEILLGNLRASYEFTKFNKFECNECGAEIENLSVSYNNVKRTSKTWDKDVSFKDFEFTKTLEFENKNVGKKVIFEFVFKVPTLNDFYSFIIKYSKELDDYYARAMGGALSTLPITLFIIPNSSIIVMATKKLKISIYEINKETNEIIEESKKEQEVLDKSEIKEVVEMYLPVGAIDELAVEINDQLKDYTPIYKLEVKCPKCGAVNELPFNPQAEFINRILNVQANR
jgi:hypothetical protein